MFESLLHSSHCAATLQHILEMDDIETSLENRNRPMARLFVQVGVSAEHLQRLPYGPFRELAAAARCPHDVCTVCQEHYGASETVTQLPCKHFFHKECITMWLKDNKLCPVCMSDVVPEQRT
jgi:hypothetical protein